ncbi:MAG TPA: hypothetical protein VGG51_13220 [Candidatus Cybelea sp.]|jgi:hypothetical protein
MQKSGQRASEVAIGYAVGPAGGGVAYATFQRAGAQDVLRLPFRIKQISPSVERAAGYAALVVVARAIHRLGVTGVRFVLADEDFVREVASRAEVPDNLVLPYVRLRCALNALGNFEIAAGPTDDLMQRARAEVALNQAA